MKYRLKMNMKEEVEHSNPLKRLSQKTGYIEKFKIPLDSRDSRPDPTRRRPENRLL